MNINESDALVYHKEAGHFVNQKLARLAEIVNDFEPTLFLRYIPPADRSSEDTLPYRIDCVPNVGQPYTVFYFAESDDPIDVLARLFSGDNKRGNVLKNIEAREAAEKAFRHKAHLEELEQAADEMHFLMTSRSKNWVKWRTPEGKIVKLDSNRRRVT